MQKEGSFDVKGKKMDGNPLQVLIEKWKEIDLEGKKPDLDAQASKVADFKDSRIASRKKLAEQTKNFRKAEDSEKLRTFGVLLKAYQEEIDRLTQSSKFTENSFLSLYKVLAQAPDPIPALHAAMDDSQKFQRISELEMENVRYKTELEEFRKEFQEIQNQEVVIRQLEEQLATTQSKINTIVEEKVKESEKKLKEEQHEVISTLKEREQELKRLLLQSQEEFSRFQKTYEATQSELLELRTKYDEKQSSKQVEFEMLTDELEQARTKIEFLEAEKERLQKANLSEQGSLSMMGNSSADFELQSAQKDIEISQLREELQNYQNRAMEESTEYKHQISRLEEQLNNQKEKIKDLNLQLQQRPTSEECENLKQQLEILKKAVEYNLDSEEIGNDQMAVEKLLKEKNRKLETSLMQERASLAEKEKKVSNLEKELQQSKAKITELQGVVSKLEEDLNQQVDSSKKKTEEAPDFLQAQTGNDSSSMLQIVLNQRDRFKNRLADVEDQNKNLRKSIEEMKSEIKTLRSDNLKLYEKIRYVSSYRRQGQDLESNKDEEIEEKYSKLYEESVNPFVIFNRKEKYRRYKELNPAEKVILSSGRFFLSTKFARTFLFFYSLLLHILVFSILYKLSVYDTTQTCTVPTHDEVGAVPTQNN